MSLGNLSDAGHLGEKFKGMTIAEFLEEIQKSFYRAYGRYENASGKMYIELEHNGDADNHEHGSVKWRKGETGGELLEEETLERPQAIIRFTEIVHRGYYLAFNAITAEDFERERAKQLEGFSAIKREGVLGKYVRGEKEIFRLGEYQGVYSAERLYDGLITAGKHGLSEEEARAELASAIEQGFHRDGDEAVVVSSNPFAAWEVDTVADEDAERDSGKDADVPDMSELLKAFGG